MADRDSSRVVFSGHSLRIGEFRCPPHHPAWSRDNRTDHHLIVFPRVGVRITHAGGDPIVADPNSVMFYNPGQVYRRGLLTDRGDVCEWFNISSPTLADAASAFDPAAVDRPAAVFPFSHGPSSPQSYWLQRRLYHAAKSGHPDTLCIHEAFLSVLRDVIASAYTARGQRPAPVGPRASRARAAAAEAAKAVLASRARERLTIDQISDAVETSPFHLCRVFRQRTGLPIHRYLNRLRLRDALERLAEPDICLMRLAIDLGFASHGHFTLAFGREFGLTPSRVRADLSGRILLGLSKILAAAPSL